MTQRQHEMRREWRGQKTTDMWIEKWRESDLMVKELEKENKRLRIELHSIEKSEKVRKQEREEEMKSKETAIKKLYELTEKYYEIARGAEDPYEYAWACGRAGGIMDAIAIVKSISVEEGEAE